LKNLLLFLLRPTKSCFGKNFFLQYQRRFPFTAESIELAVAGDFLSPRSSSTASIKKISLIIESLRTNLGDVIVWADIDIRVFSLSPSKLASELASMT